MGFAVCMAGWIRDPESSRLVRSELDPDLEFELDPKPEPELQEMAQERYLRDIFYPFGNNPDLIFTLNKPERLSMTWSSNLSHTRGVTTCIVQFGFSVSGQFCQVYHRTYFFKFPQKQICIL